MGLTKLKFTIEHPNSETAIRFRINYKELNQDDIYEFETDSTSGKKVAGEIEINIVRDYIEIEIEVIGQSNHLVVFNVEYKTKKLLNKTQSELLLNNGRASKTLSKVSLNS